MANYYSKFSVAFSLPSEESQQYAINLHRLIRGAVDQCTEVVEIPECLMDEDFTANFHCEPDGSQSPGLWLWQDDGESCGVDDATRFIQHLLQKFIPPDQQDKWSVAFAYSNDCSKPRLDAFGGGAVNITANEIKSFNTFDWLQTAGSKQPA